jgi:hypothetical protein
MTTGAEGLLKWLLSKAYFEEFEVIDGLKQHPQGLTFDQWLEEKEAEIDASNLDMRPTDPRFWDCECKDNYIWAVFDNGFRCPLCKAERNDQPASVIEEIGAGGKFATDESWLIAYNMEEYYDSLDEFDLRKYKREAN